MSSTRPQTSVACCFVAVMLCSALAAQQLPLADIHVEKKPGASTGRAVVTANGKFRRIASGAYQAWPLAAGKNALALTAVDAKGKHETHLLYIDGETRKRRDLGNVPFSSATLAEQSTKDGKPAFILSGEGPHIVIADEDGVHGRLDAKLVRVSDSQLTYRENGNGAEQFVSLGHLLAEDLTGIYALPRSTSPSAAIAQFLRDGSAVLEAQGGTAEKTRWWTDGRTMYVERSSNTVFRVLQSGLSPVSGIPAGTQLTLRLLQPLASNKVKSGDPVEAVLISPASDQGKIYLPRGSTFKGVISQAHGVGWGLKHETAALTLDFRQVSLPDGETVPIPTQLERVENSQEKVNDKGKIQGIRSTGTLGHSAENKVASVASVDPIGYIFTNTAATAALGFAEPEILYPAGTEVIVEVTAPVVRTKTFPSTIPSLTSSPEGNQALLQFARQLSYRTTTQASEKPSDITNLLFIGPEEGIRRAFKAAGWTPADQLTANTTFQTVKTLAGNETYRRAPMSMLLLDERPPVFTLTKTTNTFSSRHHLRVFDPHVLYEGSPVFTASSTQDIGIGFSRAHKTFIHVIDQYIDNERTKVVNDLEFTGCVEAAQLLPRPWAPLDAYNSTGDRLRTDGAIAVLHIGECMHPQTTSTTNAVPPNRLQRITRDTLLSIRNDLYRGNLVYQGVNGTIQLRNYLAHKDDLKADRGAWRKTDISGTDFQGISTVSQDRQSALTAKPQKEESAVIPPDAQKISHRWDPPRYEIALHGGYLRFPNAQGESLGALLTPLPGHEDLPFGAVALADSVDPGWTIGISLTLNTWRWVSNEFAYTYQRGIYQYASVNIGTGPADGLETDASGIATRQFAYNVLVHARPPESRWRPYVAAGPVFQLIALTDSTVKKPSGAFRLGLQNIGLFKSAFDFGDTPPLEGGGIFQFGLQYGGGIKFRVLPRFTVQADFRETWSPNPRFLRDSYTTEYFDTENYKVEYLPRTSQQKFRQQRISIGFAFTF